LFDPGAIGVGVTVGVGVAIVDGGTGEISSTPVADFCVAPVVAVAVGVGWADGVGDAMDGVYGLMAAWEAATAAATSCGV